MAISNNSTGLRPGVCTSTTRPTAPYEGQHIYETDTDLVYLWNGSAWVETVSALTKAPRGVMAFNEITSPVTGITSETVVVTGSSFTAVANRYYKATFYVPTGDGSTVSGWVSGAIRSTNVSGTVRQRAYYDPKYTGSNVSYFYLVEWVGTLSAGSHNFVGTLQSQTGTTRAYADSAIRPFLLVEDIGAV